MFILFQGATIVANPDCSWLLRAQKGLNSQTNRRILRSRVVLDPMAVILKNCKKINIRLALLRVVTRW